MVDPSKSRRLILARADGRSQQVSGSVHSIQTRRHLDRQIISVVLGNDFPLKYLGVLLAITKKIPRHALQPFIDKVVDHLSFWKGQLMNHSGRLALIRSTLSAMTTHLAISIGLPPWVLKALEKIMKAFLRWHGAMFKGHWCSVVSGFSTPRCLGKRSDNDGCGFSSQILTNAGRCCHARRTTSCKLHI
jgi:hypothetical protein